MPLCIWAKFFQFCRSFYPVVFVAIKYQVEGSCLQMVLMYWIKESIQLGTFSFLGQSM